MKRLTAVLLIVCLLASMCSVGVWADDESAMPETENSQGESTVIQETEEPDTEQDAESVEAEEEASAEETVETEEEASTEEEAPAEQTDTAASETPEAETTEAEDADEAAETIVEAAGEEAATLGSAAQTNTLSVTYINPLYADVITEDDLVQPAEAADVPSVVSEDDEYVSTSEAAVQMRASLVSRVETITVKYTADEYAQEDVSSIYSQALEHTGTPTEGDYLKWQTGGYKASISYYSSGGVCYITVAYTMTYYTTAAQEAELTTALTSVLSSLDLDSKDEVEKICAIYQYICANVTYDYTNLNDSSYMLKYTAYAALMNGTAVCQGYSLLFYRMALEAGLDARIISGTRTSTGENHGWNIVQIGDYYYNLDSTWDANYSYGNYKYFLLCNANFSDHTRDDDYTTTSFYAAYPMSSSDYPCPYGHSYVSAVTAPTCTEQGYTTYTCSNCGDSYVSDYTDALGHTTEIQNAEDATCTEDGYTGDEVCTVCGETITTGEVIPATGHTTEVQNAKAATCTEDGYTGDEVCTVCGETVTAGEVIAATGHTWGEGVVTTEATCTEAGVMTYTCTVCGATKTEAIAATGHTAGEAVIENEVAATCTEDGSYDSVVYCTVCGEELSRETVTVSATGHNYVGVVTAPTCTKGGYTTYTCSVCGDSYVADETEATGHTWDEGKVTTEATCTTDGVMTYTCTACGETKTEAIAATGHTAGEAVTENEVAATCTEDGTYDSVVYCTACGEELSRETVTVPATGHTAGEAVVENEVAATCTEDGSYDSVVYCTECREELSRETITVSATGHTADEAVVENEVAATCTDDGSYDSVVYCTTCGEELSRETVTVSATGHTTGEAVIENEVAATCTEDGSYESVVYCTVCGEELSRETITVSATGHSYVSVVTAPTCTKGGYTTYTCSACGDSYVADETEATGHSWDEGEVTTEATCTEDGVMTYTCTVCGETKTEAISATGHTAGESVVENEVAATCTEDGSYDSVVYCTACREELSRETITVAATGHTTGEAVIENEVAATCTEDGSYESVVYCTVCGEELSRETITVSATGHTTGEAVIENEVAATCTEEGSYDSVVYCTVCEEELSRESVTVPATGHTWNEGEVTTAATATTDGEMTYTCTVCGETKTETIAATGSPDNTQTQTVCDDLTEVPAGLADKYTTVEELTEDIISMVTASAGYTEENTAVYDVKLQISTDGGLTWVDATEENFPEGGITVTLPYPDGTDSSYDFTVVHMFAVTSARLGIVAGETESPTVTKGETTISFTLTGLSPVAIAWKEGAATETPASTTTATVEPTTTAASPNTGDDASIGLWLALAMACVCGLAVTVAAKKKKG